MMINIYLAIRHGNSDGLWVSNFGFASGVHASGKADAKL
jgi:hypothetical protein